MKRHDMKWMALGACALLFAGCESKVETTEEVAQADPPGEVVVEESETEEVAQPVVEEEVAPAAAAPGGFAVGKPAPDFTLTDQDGATHTLSDLKGKVVVLEWTNPGCPYVQRHYNDETMTESSAMHGDEVTWLAVDSSNFVKPEDAKKWREEKGLPYPVLLDPDGKVGKLYEAKTTPHMYVIDAEGLVRYSGAIDDDARGEKKSAERTNYVSSAVEALLEGKEVEMTQTKPYGCSVKYGS